MIESEVPVRSQDGSISDERMGTFGRMRKASESAADAVLNFNPQPGMWAATGIAIAYAPTFTELREPVNGGENIQFNSHGHSVRNIVSDGDSVLVLPSVISRSNTRMARINSQGLSEGAKQIGDRESPSAGTEDTTELGKHGLAETVNNGFKAARKFVSFPTGFLITIYGLNVVAWGAMLFFLLLKTAPAMNHPDGGDADSSPRKIWLEIDSQILNALFCVTGFGLALGDLGIYGG